MKHSFPSTWILFIGNRGLHSDPFSVGCPERSQSQNLASIHLIQTYFVPDAFHAAVFYKLVQETTSTF